jgi:hypothetical protein
VLESINSRVPGNSNLVWYGIWNPFFFWRLISSLRCEHHGKSVVITCSVWFFLLLKCVSLLAWGQ